MPTYDYMCQRCDTTIRDVVLPVADRHVRAPSCPTCNEGMTIWITGCMEGNWWKNHRFLKPFFDPAIGKTVRSYEEHKAACEGIRKRLEATGNEYLSPHDM